MNYLKEIEDLGYKILSNKSKARFCKYKCKCGNIIEVKKTLVVNDRVKSCGCLKIEKTRERIISRNTSHGLSKHPLYKKWKDMKSRCNNIKNKEYKNYGGRGIIICDEWENDFQAFYDWALENGYQEHLTIDRINVNGNYEPDNCRFATLNIQARNRRAPINKTGYTGVSKIGNKYSSNISIDNKSIYLGLYNTPKEAYQSRKNYIDKHNTGHKQQI